MSVNYNSIYLEYANTEKKDVAGDTREQYQKNCKERTSVMERYGWLTTPVTYTFNSHGFRCEEFTDDPSIMFLGCSFTFGLGVPNENIWPTLVAQNLGLKSVNLGQAGGSHDAAFRLCHRWIEQIKPKICILLSPPIYRIEVIEPDMITFFTTSRIQKDKFSEFYNAWLSTETNSQMNALKNTLAIENLCIKNGTKFIKYDSTDFKRLDWARDLGHPGVISHRELASKILKLVEAEGIEPF